MPLRHAGEESGFRGVDRVRGADVHPHAFEAKPAEPSGLGGTVEQR